MKILSVVYAAMLYFILYAGISAPNPSANLPITVDASVPMVEQTAPTEPSPYTDGSYTVKYHELYTPYLHSDEFKAYWAYLKSLPPKRKEILDCADYKNSDLVSLACNIYHEGRGESLEGQLAIINVTMNRVNTDDHPDSIAGVVWERVRRVPQFSWTADGKSDIIREERAWERSMMLAQFAIDGEIVDITNGSLYYHVTTLKNDNVDWFKTALNHHMDIGRHSFYGI